MVLLLISFLAGVLTVLAPCILPLLPVIIGGTLAEGGTGRFDKRKAFTIISSLGLSVIIFTLLLKASTLFINIPPSVWTWLSGLIIIFFGLVTIFPALWESQLLAKLSAKSNILLGKGEQKQNWWGDVVVGAALGPVFSTCSPTYFIVLATVLPVSPVLGLTYLLAYVIGLSLSLLVVAVLGQKIMDKLGVVADPRGWFKRTLGVLFLIVGVAIIAGWDKRLQLVILEAGFFDVTQIEQRLLEHNNPAATPPESPALTTPPAITTSAPTSTTPLTPDKPAPTPVATRPSGARLAPELSTIDGYINTAGQPITLASLRGKVVLLDIWTYSCINCQRTLPYLKDWYAKYHDQGLEIVGLHTPEFAFEQVQANVEKAVRDFGLTYPVVLDNDYSTWRALGNQFWPRKYLIDREGYIIYDHIGEGAYEETEREIQKALRVSGATSAPADAMPVEPGSVRSPEIYFGSARRNPADGVTLSEEWRSTPEYIENNSAARISYSYNAKNVYLVAGSASPVSLEVYVDGKRLKTITIQAEQLYQLVSGDSYGVHSLELRVKQPGLRAFTFTFG